MNSRRDFLSKLVVGAATLSATVAFASSHGGGHGHGNAGDGQAVKADAKETCATCQFWGGMRKVSDDKKLVLAQSMGWCNNPDSMNYQKLTAPDRVMKKSGMWKKWAAL